MASMTVPELIREEPDRGREADGEQRVREQTGEEREGDIDEEERGEGTDGEEREGDADEEERGEGTGGEERERDADEEERREGTTREEREGDADEEKRGEGTDGEERGGDINEEVRAQEADGKESIALPSTSTQTDVHTQTNVTETLNQCRILQSRISSQKDRFKRLKERLHNLARQLEKVKKIIQESLLACQTCPVQEENPGTHVSMIHQPTTRVERRIHDNFRLLVHRIQLRVSPETLRQLRRWASEIFGIPVNENWRVWDVFYMLDEAGLINASDLMLPREFFARICRFQIVDLVNEFMLGNYAILRNNQLVAPNNQLVAPNNRPVELRFFLPGKRLILSSLLALSMFKITTNYYYYYITLILRMLSCEYVRMRITYSLLSSLP